jgi:hypothetical protein
MIKVFIGLVASIGLFFPAVSTSNEVIQDRPSYQVVTVSGSAGLVPPPLPTLP